MSIAAIEDDIRKGISKEQVREFMRADDRRAYLDFVADWLGIIASFAAVSICPSPITYLIAFCAIGFCQYGLFILGHDALHSSFLRNKKMNDIFAKWLIYGPMGMGFADGRRNHLEHHRRLGTEQDPDRYIHSLENKDNLWQFFLFLIGFATFFTTVAKVTPFGALMKAKAKRQAQAETGAEAESVAKADSPAQAEGNQAATGSSSAQSLLTRYLVDRIPVLLAQAVIISGILLVAHLPWWSYVVLWIAPIYLFVFVADEIRAFCDHAVEMLPDRAADDQRLITFVPPSWEATIFSPHNMNYHAEHHIWPSMPYYNRPKAHKLVAAHKEITVKHSYVAFLSQLCSDLNKKRVPTGNEAGAEIVPNA